MLKREERTILEEELFTETKATMKEILNLGQWALNEEDFTRFKKSVFNNFGKSGLQIKIEKILDKYEDK